MSDEVTSLDSHPAKILQGLLDEHGETLVHARTRFGLVAFRPPTDAEFKRFQDKVGDKKTGPGIRELVNCCRVYPDADAFLAVMVKLPALYPKLGEALVNAAGADVEVVTGKS